MATGPGGLWQSTPLRLSIAIAALFAAVSLASFAATYVVVRRQTEAALQEALQQEVSAYRAVPFRAALVSLVDQQSRSTSPERRILSYRLPGGTVVGNAALVADGGGYRLFVLSRDAAQVEGTYYALSEPLFGGLLTVAINARAIEDVRRTFTAVFLFSVVPTSLLVLGGGVLIARRSERRLALIEGTLDALTRGDLAARVMPLDGAADDLSRIAQQIDRMAEAQERQVGALRQVSADIAHDLKTPIQRVSVLLERIRESDGLPGPVRDLADRAGDETRSITRVFHALLQIAQIEGGTPRARFGPVDLGTLAGTVVELFAPAAEEKGHPLHFSPPVTPAVAHGDRTLIGQVLSNLIENALNHTPSGCPVTVAVGHERPDRVWLEVADTGPGIPEAERTQVLRRLYRLERSRTTPGSGLGLSLVAAVVDLHDGQLSLSDNAPGLRVRAAFPVGGSEPPGPDGRVADPRTGRR